MGIVSMKLRASAKGQDCTLQFPCCNHNPETTVLAHLPSLVKGMSTKSDDFHAVFACSDCHTALDQHTYAETFSALHCFRALQRTIKFWVEEGYLRIINDKDEPRPRLWTKKSLPPKPLSISSTNK